MSEIVKGARAVTSLELFERIADGLGMPDDAPRCWSPYCSRWAPRETIAFEKQCSNYRFSAHDRELLATVVTVPELAGETFIELETPAEPDDVDAALAVVRTVLTELSIEAGDFTTEQYTAAAAARRR